MKTYARDAVSEGMRKFCHLAKEHEEIEVSRWYNGEGFDVQIGDRLIQFTHGELAAINTMIGVLEAGIKEEA